MAGFMTLIEPTVDSISIGPVRPCGCGRRLYAPSREEAERAGLDARHDQPSRERKEAS